MTATVANFINRHQDEIDSDDFVALFLHARGELTNKSSQELFEVLSEVFGEEEIGKQREGALRFILTMVFDDFDPEYTYTFANFIKYVLSNELLGYTPEFIEEYITQNAEEFDIEIYTLPTSGLRKIRKIQK